MAQHTTPLYYGARTSEEEGKGFPRGAGLFMALFLAAGLLLALANPALLDSPREPLLDGSWAAAYQERFDSESLLFEPATTIWGVLEYALFDQGRPGLLIGSDGWLYSTEEFAYPSQPELAAALLEANLAEIAAVDERLRQQGVELVVALLPAKARVYPEHLGRYRLPEGPSGRYQEALAGLQERGVTVVNLLQPLLAAKENGSVFLRTDTHWTPFGARVAARRIAGEVARLGPFQWLDEQEYVTSSSEPRPYRGDLTRFLPLGTFYEAIGPADDLLKQFETSASSSAGSDLFAAVQLPVVLVGTSYSQDERWNFPGWLREALGNDVLVAAQRGEGPYEPMIDYLDGEAFSSAPPRLVIWEIPERYLSDRWQSGEDEN